MTEQNERPAPAAPRRPAKKPAVATEGIKLLIGAASLAGTIGGWALLSGAQPAAADAQPAPAAAAAPAPQQPAAPAPLAALAPLPTIAPLAQAADVRVPAALPAAQRRQAPVAQAPVAQAQAPAAQAPVVQAPVVQAPVVQAPMRSVVRPVAATRTSR